MPREKTKLIIDTRDFITYFSCDFQFQDLWKMNKDLKCMMKLSTFLPFCHFQAVSSETFLPQFSLHKKTVLSML